LVEVGINLKVLKPITTTFKEVFLLIVIGNEAFKTKKAATEKVQEILYSYKPNEFLNFENKIFIENLIFNHPNSEEKIGSGIQGIQVRQNPFYKNTRNFYIVRTDSSETDFSFLKCITVPTQKAMFLQAARKATEPFMKNFKREYFIKNNMVAVCEIIGIEITYANSHVDHIPPNTFENIIKDFIEEENLDINTVQFKPSADNQFGKEFENEELLSKWNEFHNKRADLRVISARANLSNVRREAIKMKKAESV
jgi:hypothetical protein